MGIEFLRAHGELGIGRAGVGRLEVGASGNITWAIGDSAPEQRSGMTALSSFEVFARGEINLRETNPERTVETLNLVFQGGGRYLVTARRHGVSQPLYYFQVMIEERF